MNIQFEAGLIVGLIIGFCTPLIILNFVEYISKIIKENKEKKIQEKREITELLCGYIDTLTEKFLYDSMETSNTGYPIGRNKKFDKKKK